MSQPPKPSKGASGSPKRPLTGRNLPKPPEHQGRHFSSAPSVQHALAPAVWTRTEIERRVRELLLVGGDLVARQVSKESGWEQASILSVVGDVVGEIARNFENSRPDHRALADFRLAKLSEAAWRGEPVRNRKGRITRVTARDPHTLEPIRDVKGRAVKVPHRMVDHALILKIEAARMVVQGVDQAPPELPRANPETGLQRSMRAVLDALTPEERAQMVEEARELERRAGHQEGVRSIGHRGTRDGEIEEDG